MQIRRRDSRSDKLSGVPTVDILLYLCPSILLNDLRISYRMKYFELLVMCLLITVASCANDRSNDRNLDKAEVQEAKKQNKKGKNKRKKNKKDETNNQASKAEKEPSSPDTYPLYPGCSDVEYEVRKACAQQKMMQTLQKVIKYPSKAVEDNVNGTVLHSFVIEADGTMSNLTLTKALTPETDAAAYHAIEAMMGVSGPWEPATLNGKAVAARYTLPIKFEVN